MRLSKVINKWNPPCNRRRFHELVANLVRVGGFWVKRYAIFLIPSGGKIDHVSFSRHTWRKLWFYTAEWLLLENWVLNHWRRCNVPGRLRYENTSRSDNFSFCSESKWYQHDELMNSIFVCRWRSWNVSGEWVKNRQQAHLLTGLNLANEKYRCLKSFRAVCTGDLF